MICLRYFCLAAAATALTIGPALSALAYTALSMPIPDALSMLANRESRYRSDCISRAIRSRNAATVASPELCRNALSALPLRGTSSAPPKSP
ncbi:hypothetical protein DFJ74DRAFT_674813 [Hyaloraphidium curvatum]|nr:hypothetical protein DFJ74DRAFT_674813 [Hyaloraphidium curvatum]